MTAVGFVGAGRMGGPMVGRLTDAGHRVRVLARSPEKCRTAEQLGATATADLAAVVTDADLVVLCVFTDEQVLDVCTDSRFLPAMTPGATVVLHTTGSPHTAEQVAARAREHGVTVMDAPVSGGPHDIAAGTLTLFAGGDDTVVERAGRTLAAYADPIVHVGPVGSGQRVKLVNNALFAANIGLVAESVRLAGQLGVDEAALLAALEHGSAASRALTGASGRGSIAAFTRAVSGFLEKDVDVVRRTVADLGGSLGILGDVIDSRTAC